MPISVLASLPNSRIKPRAATTQADSGQVACPIGVATLIKAANINRTYLSLRNISGSDDGYYGYRNTIDATDGFLLKAGEPVDLESPGDIYFFNGSLNPITICWDEGQG